MNSVVEARITTFLMQWYQLKPTDCPPVLHQIESLARMAGYEVDVPFGRAALGAGPEARVASSIVARALVGSGGGAETSDDTIRAEINQWLRTSRKQW